MFPNVCDFRTEMGFFTEVFISFPATARPKQSIVVHASQCMHRSACVEQGLCFPEHLAGTFQNIRTCLTVASNLLVVRDLRKKKKSHSNCICIIFLYYMFLQLRFHCLISHYVSLFLLFFQLFLAHPPEGQKVIGENEISFVNCQ